MDNSLSNSFPENIKKELEAIQQLILPLVKKTSRYMFWTFPLIGVSAFNLIYLLFMTPRTNDIYVMLFIYAIVGAIGLALLKETKINKKEIERIGRKYMIDRIRKSHIMTDERKNHYIIAVKEERRQAMESFVKFLQEEDRLDRWKNTPLSEEKKENNENEQ